MNRPIRPQKTHDRLRKMLRAHRQEQRLSRRALAEIIDMSTTTLANIELGTHDPTLWSLARIVDALGIDPAAVFDAIDRRRI